MIVFVTAIDKHTKEIKTVTSCDLEDSQKYANYYRRVGYNSKVMSASELENYLEDWSRENKKQVNLIWEGGIL